MYVNVKLTVALKFVCYTLRVENVSSRNLATLFDLFRGRAVGNKSNQLFSFMQINIQIIKKETKCYRVTNKRAWEIISTPKEKN